MFSSLLAFGSCLSTVLHFPRSGEEEALPKVPIEPRDDVGFTIDPKETIEPRNVGFTIDPKETTSKFPPIEARNGEDSTTTKPPCVPPPCCPNCPPGRWGCYCQFHHDPRSDLEAELSSTRLPIEPRDALDPKETTSKEPCFEIDPPCCPSCPPGYYGCYCENYHEPRSDQEEAE